MDSSTNETCTESNGSLRVLAYCHDGVGLGHLRRTLNICEHLGVAFENATFLVATGSPYLSLFEQIQRVDYLKLPSLTKVSNNRYESKFLTLESSQLLQCRESLLLETLRYFDPHVILIDKAPVGVCGELVSALRWVREHRPGTRIVFGMRDIEDEVEATVRQWSRLNVQKMLEEHFDEVWVYGMRSVFDVASKYRLSRKIQAKLHFMGYVTRAACDHRHSGGNGTSVPHTDRLSGRVLVTVGGGTDGTTLLEAYMSEAAARTSASGGESIIVPGPDLPDEAAHRLRKVAGEIRNVRWIEFARCLSCEIQRADLVVCMGGYNTLCEIARNRKPALVVPRVHPRLEQIMRADLWAKRGLVNVLHPSSLTPTALADRVRALLEIGARPKTHELDLRGLDGVCRRFGALINGSADRATAVYM